MSRVLFTGERLHEGDALFGVDLARHHAAYEFAKAHMGEGPVLDLGSGSGYGTASLAGAGPTVFGVDRIEPDAKNRGTGAHFLRADISALPLVERRFRLVASFQVIEHLEDPSPYLHAISRFVREDGLAILTTPNLLMSDGVNPFHVREYRGDELAELLAPHFHEVDVRGVGMSPPIRQYMAERSQRIQRIMRLDPLRLRDRLPRGLIEKLFAAGALLVRRQSAGPDGTPEATPEDFPIEALRDDAIDLLAVCRRPR